MTHKADVVIVTATDTERDAVLASFRPASMQGPTVDGYPYYDYGEINGARVVHAMSRMGADGPGETRDTVERVIAAWRPWAVVTVGICWGAKEGAKKPQKIGDIILSQKLQDTAHVKLERGGMGETVVTPRGLCVPGSDRLERLLSDAVPLWPQPDKPDVKAGLLLSEPTLYNDKPRRDEILKQFPEALGGEMEGRGLYFGSIKTHTEWLVLKAVCDWGYDKDGAAKDDDQKVAARNAAGLLRFAMEKFSFASPATAVPPAGAPRQTDANHAALLRAWHASLAHDCNQLPLGTIDEKFVVHGRHVQLADVYQDLDVFAPGDSQEEGAGAVAMGLRLHGAGGERRPLIDVLGEERLCRAVLLGDAGSGKTTFVDYLCYRLASLQAGKDAAGLPPLPAALLGKPVVHLVLRHVSARHIPPDANEGTAAMIWDAIRAEVTAVFGEQQSGEAEKALHAALAAKGGVIVLDGLDEVPQSGERRKVLVQAVERFVAALDRRGEVRVLLTARPYAYVDPAWQLAGIPVLTLAPFSAAQIQGYIGQFFQTVRFALGWDATTAHERADSLAAALRGRPALEELAQRPLRLTMMATLHATWGTLPKDLSSLLDNMVDLYLERWQRQRIVHNARGDKEIEPGIAQVLEVGGKDIRAVVARLALRIHEKQLREGGGKKDCADIAEDDVILAFHGVGQKVPDHILRTYLEERAGLIVGREPKVYAFAHRSFQEFLAASALLGQEEGEDELLRRVRENPSWWREVFLFAIGSYGEKRGPAQRLLRDLLDGLDTAASECACQVASLAAHAMIECDLRSDRLDARAREWLAFIVQEGRLTAQERVEAGDLLGRIGDPRFENDQLFSLPKREDEPGHLPPGFIRVSGKHPFVFGRKPDECPELTNKWFENEFSHFDPACKLVGYDYWMARYPVTVAQWAAFMADGGYGSDGLWLPQGIEWREGRYDSTVTDKALKEWLAARTPALRRMPRDWSGQEMFANRPVVGVCWFEAMAYARWLHGKLAGKGWVPANYEIRLPTEAEWEKAARVGHGGMVPWGAGLADAGHANMDKTIGHASPVGAYPSGRQKELGIDDMVGNVWEWTCSLYGKEFQPGAFRENRALGAGEYPSVRGGSWWQDAGGARCAVRDRFHPGYGNGVVGLRLVLSLANSEY